MQASQSNNASDLLTLGLNADRKLDSNLSPIFPSPFSSPIQAARRYIERQKGAVEQAGDWESEIADPVALQANGNPASRNSGARNSGVSNSESSMRNIEDDSSRGESCRERDRRLERSLYEGHSIEASLSFEGNRGDEIAGAVALGRASLIESDGSESLFRYADSGPVPDPEAIRGAILRLARESERGREIRLGQGGDATEEDAFAALGSSENGSVQALDFGDVARRVWESSVAQRDTYSAELELQQIAQIQGTAAPTAKPTAATPRAGEGRKIPATDGVLLKNTSKDSARGTLPGGHGGVADQQSAQRVSMKMAVASQTGSISAGPKTPTAAVCDVEGEPALAHDACNLLSALTLYSELLGSPGVLEAQYRHYAEELKLLAFRSRVLIDRLLQGAASPGEETVALQVVELPNAAVDPAIGTLAPYAGNAGAGDGDAGNAVPESGHHVRMDRGADLNQATDLSVLEVQAFPMVARGQTGAAPEEAEQVERASSAMQNASAENSRAETLSPVSGQSAIGGDAAATNLADLLTRWGSLLSTLAHGTLDVVLGPNCATPVPAVAEDLERILVNLVRNARAATLEGGAIRICLGVEEAAMITERGGGTSESAPQTRNLATAHQTGDAKAETVMVLAVDDSGCGMTESQVRRTLGEDLGSAEPMFTPHASAKQRDEERRAIRESGPHAASTNPGAKPIVCGSTGQRRGLGLRIVRELVASSGGTLSIQSWPGRGTRIEIRWPVPATSVVRATAPEARLDRVEDGVGVVPAVVQATASTAADASALTSISSRSLLGAVTAEIPQGKVGPDGFSETELRSMILRLHRSAPQDRGPLSRRQSNRPPGTRSAGRGFAAQANTIYSVQGYGVQRDELVGEDSATKGAIAC